MKLRIQVVLGLILALALAPAFWPDRGSARAQSDQKSSESMQPELAATWAGPVYSGWSLPVPVPFGYTAWPATPTSISRDGLSLYLQQTDAATGDDVYVAHRPTLESSWSVPVKLPDAINTTANEHMATVSADGLSLYFSSDRAGGTGGYDLYVSRRTNVGDDGDWQPPENLSTVNTRGFDSGPTVLEGQFGPMQLYFACAPAPGGTAASADIYVSTMGPGGFGPAQRVAELSSRGADRRPYLRRDGREIYFFSDRSGSTTIYRSRRNSMTDRWTPPVAAFDPADLGDPRVFQLMTPVLDWDATTLYLGVYREDLGRTLIYVAHRTKMLGTLDP